MTAYYGDKKIKKVYLGTQNTNCITYIPQDIKYTLVDGVLTVKAGSKVYVPNGAEKFNEVVTESDLTTTIKSNGTYLIYKLSGNAINYQALGTASSGSTDSLSGQNWHIWYDTTNNLIKRYGASAQLIDSNCSFPIAIVTVSNGAISSIDQVFNGFGYIGGVSFYLPGVKGFVPNGYNTDGTYKSNIINVTKVLLCTDTSTRNNQDIRLSSTATGYGDLSYNSALNQNEINGSFRGFASVGKISISGGKITSLTPNSVQPEYTAREINRIYNGQTLVYGYKPEQVLFEKSTAGTYTLNLEHSGDYEVTIVGGGGGGAYNGSKKFSDGVISGGSGAGFKGVIHLKSGTHIINVGAGGESVNPYNEATAMPKVGTNSSIDNLIIAGCANEDGTANAGIHGSGNVISKGGVLTYDKSVVKSYTLATNGNDGLEGWNTSVEGAASVISGTTYGAGDKGQNNAMTKGYDGYVKIVAI